MWTRWPAGRNGFIGSAFNNRPPGIDAADFPACTPLMGTLYHGDKLDILRRCLRGESVDLVYLGPSFNSGQNYNAFFLEKNGLAASEHDAWI